MRAFMARHPCVNRFAAWLALVAMAAAVLLPTLSHAHAFRASAPQGGGYAEVCTPLGMKLVSLADGHELPAHAGAHFEHCPCCGAGLGACALPPVLPALPVLALAGGPAPPLCLHAPRPPHAWASAQPRAPPSRG
jgi:hypothetical protein